jgi:hypothetical protein
VLKTAMAQLAKYLQAQVCVTRRTMGHCVAWFVESASAPTLGLLLGSPTHSRTCGRTVADDVILIPASVGGPLTVTCGFVKPAHRV